MQPQHKISGLVLHLYCTLYAVQSAVLTIAMLLCLLAISWLCIITAELETEVVPIVLQLAKSEFSDDFRSEAAGVSIYILLLHIAWFHLAVLLQVFATVNMYRILLVCVLFGSKDALSQITCCTICNFVISGD